MKKKLSIVIILFITIILTGCGNNKAKEEMQSMELVDYKSGNVTFQYPKSLSFSVEQRNSEDGSSLYVISHDYLVDMNIFIDYDVNDNYNEMISECKKTKAYREYTWNEKYKGISCGNQERVSFIVKLYESEIGYIRYLYGDMAFEDNQAGDLISVFNEKGIQNLLNTMEYKK